MNIDNNFMNCPNKEDFKPNNCCPKVVFAILPTNPTEPVVETPTLTIGTVTTGEPGTEAAATITGTAPNFVLNLTIPQGPAGVAGPVA